MHFNKVLNTYFLWNKISKPDLYIQIIGQQHFLFDPKQGYFLQTQERQLIHYESVASLVSCKWGTFKKYPYSYYESLHQITCQFT